MKGLTVAKIGAPYEVQNDIKKPVPGKGQILVKSIFTGINPVETYMQSSGLLVEEWPIVLGCDASGVVVEVGDDVTKFKQGDYVFGCTRLGVPGYCTFQEYFLMDEHLAFLKPKNITAEEAATLGVGLDTAGLGLLSGMGLELPPPGAKLSVDEWIIILGGSGCIGQFAIQVAKVCGYKVLATCSPAKATMVKGVGADATIDYKVDLQAQLDQIKSITNGNFSRILDANSGNTAQALSIITEVSTAKKKIFSTTDDWSPIEAPAGVIVDRIKLGQIGRSGALADVVNKSLASYIPKFEALLESGELKPMQYSVVGSGYESIPEGIKISDSGKMGGTKVVIKLGDL
jgi:NADPH:quinone reductase-like Zn-dependent oxidoreductase